LERKTAASDISTTNNISAGAERERL